MDKKDPKRDVPDSYLSIDGVENPDPTPIAVPLHFKRPMSMVDRMRMLVRNELSRQATSEGSESFEEADDFNVGDDYDPKSPYEEVFEPIPPQYPNEVLPPSPSSESKPKKSKKTAEPAPKSEESED